MRGTIKRVRDPHRTFLLRFLSHARAAHPRQTPAPVTIPDRIHTWRQDAAVLRRYGDTRAADLLERMAAELEADTQAAEGARVSLADAVELTGYTRGHLRRLVLDGKLRNVGTDQNTEFLAAELPRKARYVPGQEEPCGGSVAGLTSRLQVARAIVRGD